MTKSQTVTYNQCTFTTSNSYAIEGEAATINLSKPLSSGVTYSGAFWTYIDSSSDICLSELTVDYSVSSDSTLDVASWVVAGTSLDITVPRFGVPDSLDFTITLNYLLGTEIVYTGSTVISVNVCDYENRSADLFATADPTLINSSLVTSPYVYH